MRCCRAKLIRWGKTKFGTVRWQCPSCGKTRVRQRNSFPHGLLARYLLDNDTYEQLGERCGVSPRTVTRRIIKVLDAPPPKLELPDIPSPCWLVTDAAHFKRWGCLFITKAVGLEQPLAVSFHQRECYESAVNHLLPLTDLPVTGYTLDGRRGLVLAYQQIFPDAAFQRCLVHVRFRVQTLLTSHPKLEAGAGLLALTRRLKAIKTTASAFFWWEDFSSWQKHYWTLLHERSYKGKSWWHTHRNLRRAWRHVLNAGDHLFVFLAKPNSVSHTNALEGIFGQRKPALSRHRGLSRKRVSNAILWTFYLRRKMTKSPTLFVN